MSINDPDITNLPESAQCLRIDVDGAYTRWITMRTAKALREYCMAQEALNAYLAEQDRGPDFIDLAKEDWT